MGIDHTGAFVSSSVHAAALAWYEAALKPVGYKKWHTEGPNQEVAGFSDTGRSADFWLIAVTEEPNVKSHHAFTANDRVVVDAFHAAGIAAGGKCNGPPGVRHYHPNYYAAFVLDPAGNNIEVVCHAPVTEQ
ncbi:Glyoxalase/Bleomycin resistance protein/Dihydroxybiphenyl dioxygenase [Bisporella sp. PMI_857]|nr:Glyoxalase/Bleomycin resistance protein/Dihydroxybiphenyl dioxygenase [Bisporella sp. PMI_857]